MRSAGYTLIELLVVISIIALMAVMSFISYGNFQKDKAADKALGEVQTILRLAQSNATSSTLCNGQAAANWKVVIPPGVSGVEVELRCDPGNNLHKSYSLQNASISEIKPSCGTPVDLVNYPLTITYSSGKASLSFSSTGASASCLASDYWTFTINSDPAKSFKLSRGGAIDVQ